MLSLVNILLHFEPRDAIIRNSIIMVEDIMQSNHEQVIVFLVVSLADAFWVKDDALGFLIRGIK